MKKPYWVLLIAVVVCSCGRTKEVAPAPSSSLEDMELTGKVKQITEINNTRVNPELFAFSKPGFGDVFFMDYYLSLYAFCEANGINYINDIIAGRREVPEDFDYYYEDQGADDFAYTIYSFDKSGYLTRTQCYWEKMEGNPTEQEINTYDDHHNLLRSEHLNDSLKVCYAHDFEYNADGFITRDSYFTTFGSNVEYLNEYDEYNCMTRAETRVDGKRTHLQLMTYNKNNELIQQITSSDNYYDRSEFQYYTSGKAKGKERSHERFDQLENFDKAIYTVYSDDMKERWEYNVDKNRDTISTYYYQMDERGNDIYEADYELDNENPATISRYSFDQNDNATMVEWQGREPSDYYLTTMKYDSKGRMIDDTFFSLEQGALRTHNVSKYGSNDRLETVETYMQVVDLQDRDNTEYEQLTEREVYYYDSVGNWIKHEIYDVDIDGNELLMRMTTRKIEYYED
jgi:hypothetical protein